MKKYVEKPKAYTITASSSINESKTQQEELKNMLSGLNDVYRTAFVTAMHGLVQGKPIAEAVEDGNKILVANGKKPAPYPFPQE